MMHQIATPSRIAQPVSRKTILGLSLGYDLLDYDFSDDAALESASPWDRIHGLNLALPSSETS